MGIIIKGNALFYLQIMVYFPSWQCPPQVPQSQPQLLFPLFLSFLIFAAISTTTAKITMLMMIVDKFSIITVTIFFSLLSAKSLLIGGFPSLRWEWYSFFVIPNAVRNLISLLLFTFFVFPFPFYLKRQGFRSNRRR